MAARIRKGDMVEVISGRSKGERGHVLKIKRDENRVIVENVNMVKRHQSPKKFREGGIVEKEAAIHISNLQVLDPKSGKPTKVGRKLNAKGKLVRYAKKSGEEIK